MTCWIIRCGTVSPLFSENSVPSHNVEILGSEKIVKFKESLLSVYTEIDKFT